MPNKTPAPHKRKCGIVGAFGDFVANGSTPAKSNTMLKK